MRLQALCLLAAVSLLAACSSAPKNAGGGQSAAQVAPAQTGVRPGSQDDLNQTAGNRVFFAFDKSDINAEGKATLEKQAEWLKKYPNVTVTVQGNCDPRGTREYNLALGERRANAAKNAPVALGIPASRVSTISYGKERPAIVGDNDAAYAQDRRDETVVN